MRDGVAVVDVDAAARGAVAAFVRGEWPNADVRQCARLDEAAASGSLACVLVNSSSALFPGPGGCDAGLRRFERAQAGAAFVIYSELGADFASNLATACGRIAPRFSYGACAVDDAPGMRTALLAAMANRGAHGKGRPVVAAAG